MNKRKIATFVIGLTLAVGLSACGNTASTSDSASDAGRIAELEQELKDLKAENENLKEQLKAENENLEEQLENSDSTENNQQSDSMSENLLKTTIASPETSGVCGANLTWYYQNGVLAITGTGEMTDYSYNWSDQTRDTPWDDLKEQVGWVIIDDGATTVGEYAFSGFKTLSKVILPDSITSIGAHAFSGGCSNLSEITLPNSLTSIGMYAFENCLNLSEVTIPNSVTSIGVHIFLGCPKNVIIRYNEQSYTIDEFKTLMRELGIME